jgi:hypothetical protein
MNSSPFEMRLLLAAAGFRVRGATRADCIHCEGHSQGTVAFTSEVAFCHRCKWRANVVTLAREAGLLHSDSHSTAAIRATVRRRQHQELQVQRFEVWREGEIRSVSNRYRFLWRAAALAVQILSKFPECEAAWDALARFYHAEPDLSAIFDWFMFTKASNWLEVDSTPVEVFQTWRRHVA